MALRTLGNAILVRGQALLEVCCNACANWCNETKDQCGNVVRECGPLGPDSTGPCAPDCVPPKDPCECGPEKPCPDCHQCINNKCVPIECGECEECINGECVPCGPCEQCIDGECVPCGPCQKCVDGVCVPCDADEVCIGGVCVPKQYYCCYNEPESSESEGQARTTSCVPATITPAGQQNPCQHGAKSGPHSSKMICQQNCERHACAPDSCGNNHCVPDPEGEYENYAACVAACDDPCAMPCTFGPTNGTAQPVDGNYSPGFYSTDGCERDICVSYTATNGRPIRVQIWGPIMVDGCPQPDTRVIKVDSDWRCEECCDCPDVPPRSNDPGDCVGGSKGQITWTKPDGVTEFEVTVLSACDAVYTLDIQACEECTAQQDPGPCACEDNDDCAEGCECVDGACQPPPQCDSPPFCYLNDPSGLGPDFWCGSLSCRCDAENPVGAPCFYLAPSGGQPCPDGDYDFEEFLSTPGLQEGGCFNSEYEGWCLCYEMTDPNIPFDCFENYEYWPPGFPGTPPQCTPGTPEHQNWLDQGLLNSSGKCGGLEGEVLANCVPIENPLP